MKASGFTYTKLPKRAVTYYRNGSWGKVFLSRSSTVKLNESAGVLQYAQSVFEGMKVYRTKDGRIVCFRPELNFERLNDSCERMMIPSLSHETFFESLNKLAKASLKYIPDSADGGSLYIRPFVMGTSAVLGVKPSDEYEFRMFASPVGPYFKKDGPGLNLRVTDYDRAAPHGTGHIKASLNYAMSLYPVSEAHRLGFDENVYLDSATRTYIEETGGANILFVTKDGHLVTPLSDSILPSITKRSILELCEKVLNIPTEVRKVKVDELGDFAECGLCGTAAVISPVGSISHKETKYEFNIEKEDASIIKKIRDAITDIQKGEAPDTLNWLYEIK